jgi:hypothetical protein
MQLSIAAGALNCTCPDLPAAVAPGATVKVNAEDPICTCQVPASGPPVTVNAIATVNATGLADTASAAVTLRLMRLSVTISNAPLNYASTSEWG